MAILLLERYFEFARDLDGVLVMTGARSCSPERPSRRSKPMYDVTSRSETGNTSSIDHQGDVVGGDSARYLERMEAIHKSDLAADSPGTSRQKRNCSEWREWHRLSVHSAGGISRIKELYQEGAFRMRLPRPTPGGPPEVITINTAGGLTGGDRLDLTVNVERDADAVVTSQACERIYRSPGGRTSARAMALRLSSTSSFTRAD